MTKSGKMPFSVAVAYGDGLCAPSSSKGPNGISSCRNARIHSFILSFKSYHLHYTVRKDTQNADKVYDSMQKNKI